MGFVLIYRPIQTKWHINDGGDISFFASLGLFWLTSHPTHRICQTLDLAYMSKSKKLQSSLCLKAA